MLRVLGESAGGVSAPERCVFSGTLQKFSQLLSRLGRGLQECFPALVSTKLQHLPGQTVPYHVCHLSSIYFIQDPGLTIGSKP